jgi:DNA-binding transcriptional ArsR family regulator
MIEEAIVTRESMAGTRALAHPLRLALLDLLRFDGPSTATALGRRVGESSGATSYHLRQLARYGYIEEEPRAGGRERWWRYRERRVSVDGADDGDGSARKLVAELLSREGYALDHFLAEPGRSAEWDEAAFFQSRALRITAEELTELRHGIEELLAPLRRADADDSPPAARPVRILAFGFPVAGEAP